MIKRIGHDSKVGCVLQTNRRDHFPQDRSAFNQKITNYESTWNLNGRYFDGVGDYVDAGNDASLNFGTNSFAVSIWLNLNGKSSISTILIGNEWHNNYALTGWLIGESGVIWIQLKDGINGMNIESGQYILNKWTHYTWVIERNASGTRVLRYENGVLKHTSSFAAVSGSFNNANPIEFYNHNAPFNKSCLINEVRIYNRALSPAEISRLYLRRKPCLGA